MASLTFRPSFSEIILGVFGLDNRRVAKRAAAGGPPGTVPLTVPHLTELTELPWMR